MRNTMINWKKIIFHLKIGFRRKYQQEAKEARSNKLRKEIKIIQCLYLKE
jgi:hypothetical protein